VTVPNCGGSVCFPLHYSAVCHIDTQLIILHNSQRCVNTHWRRCTHSTNNCDPGQFTLIALVSPSMLLLWPRFCFWYILLFYLQGLFSEMFIYLTLWSTFMTHIFFVNTIRISLFPYTTYYSCILQVIPFKVQPSNNHPCNTLSQPPPWYSSQGQPDC
jgi:hypothetical protein